MALTAVQCAQIINQSLSDLGYDYQIETTNDTTIKEGLEKVGSFAPSQRNAIMEQINLVVQNRNYGVMFDSSKNKFRDFLVDMTENGFGIEDIFHELIDARAPLWDGNATSEEIVKDLVSYDDNKIYKEFHTEPFSAQFKCTIDKRNYDKVFSMQGISRYIDTKLGNLSWSAEYYLMQVVVGIVQKMIADGNIVESTGHDINTKEGVDNIVEDIKTSISGFKTPTNLYNKGAKVYNPLTHNVEFKKVINMTNSDSDIFLVTTPENFNRIKVQGYSNAFNLSQYEIEGRVLFVPAGTSLGTNSSGEKALFALVDRRAIIVGIKTWFGSSFYVSNTGVTNQWLTLEGVKGYNTFFNAIAFFGDSVDMYEETIGAKSASMLTIINGDVGTASGSIIPESFFGNVYADGKNVVGEMKNYSISQGDYQYAGFSYSKAVKNVYGNIETSINIGGKNFILTSVDVDGSNISPTGSGTSSGTFTFDFIVNNNITFNFEVQSA